jgi:hypothetical protein
MCGRSVRINAFSLNPGAQGLYERGVLRGLGEWMAEPSMQQGNELWLFITFVNNVRYQHA